MKTYPTKQQILSSKKIGFLCIVFTALFLLQIRLYFFVPMLISYVLFIGLWFFELKKEPLEPAALLGVRPWARFFARMIDYSIYFPLVLMMWHVFFSSSTPDDMVIVWDIIEFSVVMFILIFLEALLLSSFGYTLGKWLLKIKVRDNNNKKLSFFAALRRSFLVWLRGQCLMLPVLVFFAWIKASHTLTTNKIISWDKDCNLIVTCQKIGIYRIIFTLMLLAGFQYIFYLLNFFS